MAFDKTGIFSIKRRSINCLGTTQCTIPRHFSCGCRASPFQWLVAWDSCLQQLLALWCTDHLRKQNEKASRWRGWLRKCRCFTRWHSWKPERAAWVDKAAWKQKGNENADEWGFLEIDLGSGTMEKFSVWWSSCYQKMISWPKRSVLPTVATYCLNTAGRRTLLAHYLPPFLLCSNYFFAFIFFSTSSLPRFQDWSVLLYTSQTPFRISPFLIISLFQRI